MYASSPIHIDTFERYGPNCARAKFEGMVNDANKLNYSRGLAR
jgi:hypothetical protein